MLDQTTKRQIDTARQILVGRVPDPKAQIDQITTAMIYKFMDDMDKDSVAIGGKASFFADEMSQYSWSKIMDVKLSGDERINLYRDGIEKLKTAQNIPELFRNIFKNYYLPFYDQRTLSMFLKEINEFSYVNSENLGNAFEYLLSVLGSQGDAGQFRTPRHIIDFIVAVIDPKKNETILDPACGTAGFLISAYKHIVKTNSSNYKPEVGTKDLSVTGETALETVESEISKYTGDRLTPDERTKLNQNIVGYDLDPNMVKLALVNLHLHGFPDPKISEYDTLTSEKRWDDNYDVILANPPFMTPKGGIVPQKKFSINANRAEVLFVDYIAEHLTLNGRAGIIVPEGIIFQSANAYKNLRKSLIENWGLYAVVSLPSGVFQPYSGVKTSILLLDKEFAKRTDEILFLKVEADGFDLGAQRRKIDKNDLPACLEILEAWKNKRLLEPHSSGIVKVKKDKIAENGDFNLTGDRYRETVDYRNAKWPIVELGEVINLNFGERITKSLSEGSIFPVYGGGGESFRTDNYNREDDFVISRFAMSEKCVRYVSGKFWMMDSGGTFSIKENYKNNTNKKFIGNLLISIQNKIYSLARGQAQKNLDTEKIKQIKIPLPPLEVQEQIVTEIEQYQKVIDGAKQVVENWKPSFRIDPSWEMVELGDVCEIYGGGTPSRSEENFWNGNIPWITSKYFTDHHTINGYECITDEGLKHSSSKIAPKNSTVLITRVSVGKFAYADQDYAINQDLTALVPIVQRINEKFLLLVTSFVAQEVEKNAIGIGVKGVTRDFVVKQKIPLPSLDIQQQIVTEIESEQRAIEECKKLIKKMQKKIEAKISEVWGDSE